MSYRHISVLNLPKPSVDAAMSDGLVRDIEEIYFSKARLPKSQSQCELRDKSVHSSLGFTKLTLERLEPRC